MSKESCLSEIEWFERVAAILIGSICFSGEKREVGKVGTMQVFILFRLLLLLAKLTLSLTF